MVQIQAHRGDCRNYPENTICAYYGAIKSGYSFVELDTKFTKDDKCVLLHDATVNRTGRNQDGTKIEKTLSASDLTLEEIMKLDFGVGFSEKFKNTKIPTLYDVFDFVRDTKMNIKFDNVIQTATEKQFNSFLNDIKESGVEEYIGICLKDLDFVKKVTDKLGKCVVYYDGPVNTDIYEKLSAYADGHTLSIWLPSEKKSWLPYPPATNEDVLLAKKYGQVGIWTAHDKKTLYDILTFKPDAIEIDGEIYPSDVRNAEKELGIL